MSVPLSSVARGPQLLQPRLLLARTYTRPAAAPRVSHHEDLMGRRRALSARAAAGRESSRADFRAGSRWPRARSCRARSGEPAGRAFVVRRWSPPTTRRTRRVSSAAEDTAAPPLATATSEGRPGTVVTKGNPAPRYSSALVGRAEPKTGSGRSRCSPTSAAASRSPTPSWSTGGSNVIRSKRLAVTASANERRALPSPATTTRAGTSSGSESTASSRRSSPFATPIAPR